MKSKEKVILFAGLCLAAPLFAGDGYIILKNQRTLDQIQKIYSEMSPVQYMPSADRWKYLPETKRLLTEGERLRVVMLGDSIVNDTSRSCWNLLLEKHYPKCRIIKITSVRGSTGCWWYRKPERLQKFVFDHDPNLVMIGGISQRGNISSIRDVIRQIRKSSEADILLMTGAFGRVDPREETQWQKISDPNHYSDYRKNLEKLARQSNVTFLDMEAAWGRYIRESGKDLDWFKRDPIHANERGEQILGHILAAYLSPNAVVEAKTESPYQTRSGHLFVLSRHGCGRATAYTEFNKIVTIGTKTHVAWLDSENGQFLVRIRTLDRKTQSWSPTYTVGPAYDNHGGPSLASDNSGYLHIVYYPHHHPFHYRRSVRPNDASEWTEETQFGQKCTYSSLVCLPDDTLLIACRESSKQRWLLNLYEKLPNQVWQGPQTLFHGRAPSGYCRWKGAFAIGPDGQTFHVCFTLYEQALQKAGYAVGYLQSTNRGKSWQCFGGKPVDLPATPDTIDIVDGTVAPDGLTNFRSGNVAVDPQGIPWILYGQQHQQPFEAWIARPVPKKGWQKISLLSFIQDKWPDRSVRTSGNIAFGADGTMYVVATTVNKNVEARAASWAHPSAEIVLLVSKDRGRSFRVYEISPPDPELPNWLPNLERPTRHIPINIPSLIYTHGEKGNTNKDIMSNDVVWCDIADLIATK